MNAIVGDIGLVNKPISEPNKNLLSIFEKYTEAILSKQTEKAAYTQKVGTLITKMMGDKIPQIDMIA